HTTSDCVWSSDAWSSDLTISGSVATNDSDVDDGASLTYSLNAPVAGLTLNPNGSYSLNAGNTAYQHLAAGATTDVVANYTVKDGQGATSSSTLTITVTGVNDAPVLDASRTPVLNSENQGVGTPSGAVGTLVSSLVDFASVAGGLDNVTDVDSGAVTGIALTATDTTNGSWWYSINNGTNWIAVGSISQTQ